MIDAEIHYSSPEPPSKRLVARLEEVLRARKRASRAYLANRTIYENESELERDKVGLAVELRGWFGQKYLVELGRELQSVMGDHLRDFWLSMSNQARPEIRDVGLLVYRKGQQ